MNKKVRNGAVLFFIFASAVSAQADCILDAGGQPAVGWTASNGGCRDTRLGGFVWSKSAKDVTGVTNRTYDVDLPGKATSGVTYCANLVEGACPTVEDPTHQCDDWRMVDQSEYLAAGEVRDANGNLTNAAVGAAVYAIYSDTLVRWAGPAHTKGRDRYAWQFYLSGANSGTTQERIIYNGKTKIYSYADAICVRDPSDDL